MSLYGSFADLAKKTSTDSIVAASGGMSGSKFFAGLITSIPFMDIVNTAIELDKINMVKSGYVPSMALWRARAESFLERIKGKSPTDVYNLGYAHLANESNFAEKDMERMVVGRLSAPAAVSLDGFQAAMGQEMLHLGDLWTGSYGLQYHYGYMAKAKRYWNKFYATDRPSYPDLFIMEKKGLATKAEVLDAMREDSGYTEAMSEKVFQHLDYDPSFGELMRISDVVYPDPVWVTKKLTAMGMNEEDKAKFLLAVSKRAIRDELGRAWSGIVSDYVWGLREETDLRELLTDWELGQQEIELRVATCNDARAKNDARMKRDAMIYRFRKGVINDVELYGALRAMGIVASTSNAIVMLEDSKLGIVWEEP
jgi:hypothetical protein